jgi:hypothetical protein
VLPDAVLSLAQSDNPPRTPATPAARPAKRGSNAADCAAKRACPPPTALAGPPVGVAAQQGRPLVTQGPTAPQWVVPSAQFLSGPATFMLAPGQTLAGGATMIGQQSQLVGGGSQYFLAPSGLHGLGAQGMHVLSVVPTYSLVSHGASMAAHYGARYASFQGLPTASEADPHMQHMNLLRAQAGPEPLANQFYTVLSGPQAHMQLINSGHTLSAPVGLDGRNGSGAFSGATVIACSSAPHFQRPM